MTLHSTFGAARPVTRPVKRGGTAHASLGAWLRLAMGLLRWWRERMRARRQLRILCELDDHLLKDIGLNRSALLCEAKKPFWL
jgi:uncharacterized protein YjiS (DUF1127 family)